RRQPVFHYHGPVSASAGHNAPAGNYSHDRRDYCGLSFDRGSRSGPTVVCDEAEQETEKRKIGECMKERGKGSVFPEKTLNKQPALSIRRTPLARMTRASI